MARKRLQLPIRDLFSGLLPEESALVEPMAELKVEPPCAPIAAPAAKSAPETHPQAALESAAIATVATVVSEAPDQIVEQIFEQISEARLWRDKGWTARVVKNEEDEGWAVAMIQDGESETALLSPWPLGRDKKNPKPLDAQAFNTLVKSAGEVLRRHQQQYQAQLHKTLPVDTAEGEIRITLDIVPDDDNPYGVLCAFDADDQQLATVRVAASFKLDLKTAWRWIENDFRMPD